MLLAGMVASAIVFSLLLEPYSHLALIQVVQGAAVVTIVLNVIALWKQEARDPSRNAQGRAAPGLPGELGRLRARRARHAHALVAVVSVTRRFSDA